MPNGNPPPTVYTKANDPCLAKLGDDEPIFVIRAQDSTGDETVQRWIDRNVQRLGYNHPKIRNAIATRDAMMEWPNRKLPD